MMARLAGAVWLLLFSHVSSIAWAANVREWENLAETYLAETFPNPSLEYEARWLEGSLPNDHPGLRITGITGGRRIRSVLELQVSDQSNPRPVGEFKVRVYRWQRVAVAKKLLSKGETVTPKDYLWERRETGDQLADAVAEDGQMTNQRLKKTLTAGEVITRHVLCPPPDVAAGEATLLRVRAEGVTVSTETQALEDGFVGQKVRLQTASGRVARGTVIGSGLAEIVLLSKGGKR